MPRMRKKSRDQKYRHRRQEIERQRRMRRKVARYLSKVKILLSPATPTDQVLLREMFEQSLANYSGRTNFDAFFRHELTNYDDILDHAQDRWGYFSIERSTILKLHKRIKVFARTYLSEIGVDFRTNNKEH